MRRTVMVMVASVVTAALSAGCGGSSCEDAVGNAAKVFGYGGAGYGGLRAKAIQECKDEHFSEALRSCMASARSRDALRDCEKHRKADVARGAAEYVGKAKQSEAELNLNMLRKSLKVHFVEFAAFPEGSAPPTPATPCCAQPNHKCAADPSEWDADSVWTKLDFAVTDPGYFQYTYRSEAGDRAVVEAIGDLDCDGVPATFTLEARAINGAPEFTLTRPSRID